jgi:hypothetical protein
LRLNVLIPPALADRAGAARPAPAAVALVTAANVPIAAAAASTADAERMHPSPLWTMEAGSYGYACRMCRNIRTLYNFDPPASEEEVRAAALQYVRKVSGFTKPSRANEEAFARAIDAVADASIRLLDELETNSPAKNREVEAAKARARSAQRYAA